MSQPLPAGARRGMAAAFTALALLGLAVLPSRLAVAMRVRGGTSFERVTRALAGTAVDLSAVVLPLCVALVVVGVALVAFSRRRAFWQTVGASLLVLPACATLYVVTVVEQELKAERGAFSTMQELTEGASQSSLVDGSLGFIRYQRVWVPALGCTLVALALLGWRSWAWRRLRIQREPGRLSWALGWLGALALAAALVPGAVRAQAAASARLSKPGLGDPLASLIETSFDLLEHRATLEPSALLLQEPDDPAQAAVGAARLGWPGVGASDAGTCWPHPHARPLDRDAEPSPSGATLLQAFADVGQALLDPADPKVAVFQLSLESFRADDLHALHAAAPIELDPFVNGLYARANADPPSGVLASPKMFQAGVRTGQGLAAMTCGLGTLPYNLSLIRDFDAFPMRCSTDLLAEAGFHGWFFYGSDPSFDQMKRFAKGHGISTIVSQDELPQGLPKGAWSGLTDLVVFDQAARRVAKGLADAPQYALVMSLSNHSPYTPPEDLPEAVRARVEVALAHATHRATDDDHRRLVTHSYTDAAVEHLLGQLDVLGIAERSLVVLMADHSTGEDYVWGPDTVDHETDAAKAQVPFAVVIPPAFVKRAHDPTALARALKTAQTELQHTVLSQNDVPALLLALLQSHPGLQALPTSARWHTLGGQVTSPHFRPGGAPSSWLLGINGVDELYVLDRDGARVGSYEDAVFLKTRAVRAEVTPRLIPVASTLVETLRARASCTPAR